LPVSHTIYKEKLLPFLGIFTEQLLFHSYLRTPSFSEEIYATTERQTVEDRLPTTATMFDSSTNWQSAARRENGGRYTWLIAVIESSYNRYPVVVFEIRCRCTVSNDIVACRPVVG
jgi:hypothetical protein